MATGGVSRGAPYSWEMYDPATGTWKVGTMNGSHSAHTATLLRNNTFLVAGGSEEAPVSCEVGAVTKP